MKSVFAFLSLTILSAAAQEIVPIWPDLAPGETTKSRGEVRAERAKEKRKITRITGVTQPTLSPYLVEEEGKKPGVIILPGGGFNYVVPNLEGSEAAEILNKAGVNAFVLHYRTKKGEEDAQPWQRALQDSQRAVRFVRAHAERFGIHPKKVGILAFSAGGQVGAMHLGGIGAQYETVDEVDQQDFRPAFGMLVYPWRTMNEEDGTLLPQIQFNEQTPPTFIVHTGDDNSTSLGPLEMYRQLKVLKCPVELHLFERGGHGYGTRPRGTLGIGKWSELATAWLDSRWR